MSTRRPRDLAATRAAILDAALRLFTERGYGGVGVREIADTAQADKALITRYFGSKEGLFAEAVPATFDPTTLLEGDPSGFAQRVAEHIVGHRAGKDVDPMIATIRSLSDPAACEQLRLGLEERFLPAVAQWLGTEDAQQRAALLTAQIMGLAIGVNVLSLQALTAVGRDELVALVAQQVQSALDAAVPLRDGSPG